MHLVRSGWWVFVAVATKFFRSDSEKGMMARCSGLGRVTRRMGFSSMMFSLCSQVNKALRPTW